MADTRSIREKLVTYGHNGGRPLTDEEYADLLLTEIATLHFKLQVVTSQRLYDSLTAWPDQPAETLYIQNEANKTVTYIGKNGQPLTYKQFTTWLADAAAQLPADDRQRLVNTLQKPPEKD